MAKNTRVREHILRAIEEDQHHLLPATTYVKGFLLAYAKYLGLDPNDLLLRYERVLKAESIVPPSIPSPRPKQEISPTQAPKFKKKVLWNTKQTWVVVGVIVASLIVLYFFSPYASKPPTEPLPEKTVAQKTILKGKPLAQDKKPLTPSAPVTATTSVQGREPISLQLKAIEETWVSLQVDSQSEKEMTFKPGEGFSVQASDRIRMKLGNAGGLDLVFNGKPLGKSGRSGEVLTLIVTAQGVEVKRQGKSKPPKEGIPNSEPQSSN